MAPTPTAPRDALAHALRSRVAGPDAAARAERIWRTPGERWFTNEDPIARVNGSATMYIGGIRALLIQSLHPLAMAGVAGHSGYRDDPWGRLQRTSDYVATTTFARIDDAEAMIARVREIHSRISGTLPDGRPYAASDPHLLKWVHCAEIDSFLTSYQVYGSDPLDDAEADFYVEQSALTARKLGVVDPPTTVAALWHTLAAYRLELEHSKATSEVIDLLVDNPPLPPALRPGYRMLAEGAIAILPGTGRRLLGLADGRFGDAVVRRPLGMISTRAVHWALGQARIAVDDEAA
ncbi:MAG TPA: oxygenase MpaB family protein [Actinomycetaceae bacterium]|nr:oxygenase MpaB family protein [Actinomycetaceae bacterium]